MWRKLFPMKRTREATSVGNGFEYAPDIARAYGPELHDRLTTFAPRSYYPAFALPGQPVNDANKWLRRITDAFGNVYGSNEGSVTPASAWNMPDVVLDNAVVITGVVVAQRFPAVGYASSNTTETLYGLDTNE